MSPRLDTAVDRREAVSVLLVMLAAVMGFGALPEPVEAEDVPAVFLIEADGKAKPTNAWLIAFYAQAIGADDETAETMLRDGLAVHRHYGTDGLKAKMREMSQLNKSAGK